jgi:hypothetical protein
MENGKIFNPARRQLLTRVFPTCAVACLAAGNVYGSMQDNTTSSGEKKKHKFERPFDTELTFASFFAAKYGEFVQLAMALRKEMGGEKLLAFLKKTTTARMERYGASQAKQKGDDSLEAYVEMFRDPSYDKTLTMTIVEDSEKAFELKVTECLWAKTFLAWNLGDIGFAHICFGDYAWARGFSPKIRMIRDKTLMEGHSCCNHRYIREE